MLTHREIIGKTVEFVKTELKNAESGHDWWHVERVRRNALKIAATEPVNLFVVELAALLHDVADQKFHGGDETVGLLKARSFLSGLEAGEAVTDHVLAIMKNVSFKGGNYIPDFSSVELDVVRDADRLDAIGAIGIARAFSYGGYKGREFYNPDIKPESGMTVDQYKAAKTHTINHFYEKLLLLKDRMNTETGRRMAGQRHQFMVIYLEQFFREWEGS
jgi:uncharacterized protein